jgi:hypothetical protein
MFEHQGTDLLSSISLHFSVESNISTSRFLCLSLVFTLVSCLSYLARWKWVQHVSPKRWLTFNGLNGVMSQKIEIFKCVLFTFFQFICSAFICSQLLTYSPYAQLLRMMNWKGNDKQWTRPNLRHYPTICLEELNKTTKNPSRMIRSIRNLPKIKTRSVTAWAKLLYC